MADWDSKKQIKMPWIKYDGKNAKTYPIHSGRYRIKRYDGEDFATFNVGWSWACLITMSDFYWVEDETDIADAHSKNTEDK